MSGNLPDDWSWRAFDEYNGRYERDEDDEMLAEDFEPGHQFGCVCATCSDADLTADND